MINREDLLEGTKALYGIEFESIIVDTSKKDFICLKNDRLYDTNIEEPVSADLDNFMEALANYDIPKLFEYHASGLNCNRPRGSDKRLEFASHALSPINRKPSELFDTLEKMRDAFYNWTREKFYLPDHGTISFLSDKKNKVYTTLTGGTHMTISFPLTKTDNPTTWKYFMWMFLGLVTMYQPIYIALNGAPSPSTKGSERQRTSGSVVIGSAYIYDIFTPESGRYEIFVNSPDKYNLPDYPKYAHWNDKDLKYKEDGPWRNHTKSDIGNSSYRRSDSFNLIHNNSFIIDDKEKILYKQFYKGQEEPIYDNLIGSLASMTSNLIEFRFFDNEPIKHLLNKFNLLIRMADYAYEQSKNMEASIGIKDLGKFIHEQMDDRLNIRPLVNKRAWHDAVLESMKKGLDATFNEEFIDECYEFLSLTQFSSLLDNPEMKEITAIDLNKIFVDEMNTAEHHFSEYFQTDNPTSEYSKEYQILQLKISVNDANEKMEAYAVEKAKIELEERQRQAKIELEQRYQIGIILNENIRNKEEGFNDFLIEHIRNKEEGFNDFLIEHINKLKLTELLREKIYVDNDTLSELIKYGTEDLIEQSLLNPGDMFDNSLLETLHNWIKDSLLPDMRQKEPMLRSREDTEDRNREREREREQQAQREREKIEEQINFISNIIVKNVEKITDDKLKNLILTTIHFRKLSDTLRESIYIDKSSIQYITDTVGTTFFVSTLDDVSMNNLNDELKITLYKWFIESLLPDLEQNISELHQRSQPQTVTTQSIPQTEADRKQTIYLAITGTANRLNESSQHTVVTTISYSILTDILYKRIYEVQQSFDEIEELSELIIKDATPEHTTRTIEQENTVRVWFKVGLLSELREILLTRDQSFIATRNNVGVIEHRHSSNDYWHPEIRVHASGTDIPLGHIPSSGWNSLESPNIPISELRSYPRELSEPPLTINEEKGNIFASIIESLEQLNDDDKFIIEHYIDSEILIDEIYIRIKDDYSTDQIKGMARLITQTSIFDRATIPENKKETIDAWFVGNLIPQLIADDILKPLQQTDEIPTTYATELEALESDDLSTVDLITGIIYNNIDTLENHTLKDIIEKYIIYNYLATSLHTMIYQKHYTTVDIKNNIDILLSEGFYDEDNETDVQDSEVINLLVTWIKDFLIPDLVKETPLQLGGLAVLFG